MKSIQTRLIVVCSLIILLSGTITSYLIYQKSRELVIQSVGEQVRKVIEYAVTLIDTDRYLEIEQTREETEYYKTLREKLNEIRAMNGMKYLFTMGRQSTENGYEYYYVVDGAPFGDEEASAIGEVEENEYKDIINTFETGQFQASELTVDEYGVIISGFLPIKTSTGEMIGIIGGDFDAEKIYEQLQNGKQKMFMIMVVGVVIALIALAVFARILIRPLKKLVQLVGKVRQGDFTVEFSHAGKDEIGELTRAFQQMIQDLKSMIHAIQQSSYEITNTSQQLAESAHQTSLATHQITTEIQEVATGADQYKELAENSVHALQEMNHAISQISSATNVVTTETNLASHETKQGKQLISNTVQQMEVISQAVTHTASKIKTLQERSEEIEKIIDMITVIASQTNLLALNAAIEASRAGEHGRGFAVVADEVRKLAEESRISADQVAALIRDIQKETTEAVSSIGQGTSEVRSGIAILNQTGMAFMKIDQLVENINAQILGVATLADQMLTISEQVSQSIENMRKQAIQFADHSQTVAGATEEQLASMEGVTSYLQKLRDMAVELQTLTSKFTIGKMK